FARLRKVRARAEHFAAGDVVVGCQAQPSAEVLDARKPRHIRANLTDNRLDGDGTYPITATRSPPSTRAICARALTVMAFCDVESRLAGGTSGNGAQGSQRDSMAWYCCSNCLSHATSLVV